MVILAAAVLVASVAGRPLGQYGSDVLVAAFTGAALSGLSGYLGYRAGRDAADDNDRKVP